jgi:hypothetical protein
LKLMELRLHLLLLLRLLLLLLLLLLMLLLLQQIRGPQRWHGHAEEEAAESPWRAELGMVR